MELKFVQGGALVCLLSGALLSGAAEPGSSPDRQTSYETQVQPILAKHCTKCHGPDKQKNGLRLDTAEGIIAGGDSGEPVFVAGESATSHVIQLVTGKNPEEVMPPKGERLSGEEIQVLRSWIDQGAKLPEAAVQAARRITTDHWSFQPVQRPQPPALDHPFVANEVDGFVVAKLRDSGLEPSPPAAREVFIRRLYLVMHGLPPTPAEVDEFVHDRRADAYEALVDRVLMSPHYGERWARHWLDVVRYADSNGFETNRERKTAYHYRDYVIAALNQDKPYDQFIFEQLAGDAMGVDAATGFLVAGPYDIVKSPDINLTLKQRQDELADMVNTTGTAFLGLTLGCARCHNHKFDPVLQKDYYSLQAVFAGVKYSERPLPRKVAGAAVKEVKALEVTLRQRQQSLAVLRDKAARPSALILEGKTLRPAVNAVRNVEEFDPVTARSVRFTVLSTTGGQPCIDELEVYDGDDRNVALASVGGRPAASGTLPGYDIHQLEHVNDGRPGNRRSWISNEPGGGWVQIHFPEARRIHRVVWGRDREKQYKDRLATAYRVEAEVQPGEFRTVASSADRKPYEGEEDANAFLSRLSDEEAAEARDLQKEIARLQARVKGLTEPGKVWAGVFKQPKPTHRLYRGDPLQKREVVAPDALAVFGSLGMAVDEPEQQRRIRLARWISRPDNPLTARVLVNRLWHYIFGVGIVATPSDFGANGVPPTHPELLDWLADEFVRSGWSIKHVQRLILNSSTFRQAGKPRAAGLAKDAGGQLLWRFSPRRLEAEAIRDCILAVSGALDRRMGGPGFYLLDVEVENVMHYFPKETFGPAEFRRMVYQTKIRQEQDAIFGSFDCPDGNQVIAKRSRSNTPLQALNLFNSRFVLQQAELLAERLEKETAPAEAARVRRAFRLLYGRQPDRFELENSRAMIREEGLPAFCRAIYNTSEFLFVF